MYQQLRGAMVSLALRLRWDDRWKIAKEMFMAKDQTDIEKRKEEERRKQEETRRQQSGQPVQSGQTGQQGGNRPPQPGQPWNQPGQKPPAGPSTTNPKVPPQTTPRRDAEHDTGQEDTDKRRRA
jgi:hypothetical protein